MQSSNKSSDVLVVGAGVFGAWIALAARRAGYTVRLIDQYKPAHKWASSAGKSRIIRMAYAADEVYTRLAARSLVAWKKFFAETGHSGCFQQTGVLWMALENDVSLGQTKKAFQAAGIIYEDLNSDTVGQRYPQICISEGTRALFEPQSGALLAEESIEALIDAALQAGVHLETATIRSTRTETGWNHTVTSEDGRQFHADLMIFACGSWLPKLFPEVLGNVIMPTRQELFFFDTPSENRDFEAAALPIWIDGTDARFPYGFPNLQNAGVKLAFHRLGPPFDPDTNSRAVDDSLKEEAARYLYSRFPGLQNMPLRSTMVCHYENTINGHLLIDRHPQWENVWFVGGGSGHGFKHGPGVAEILLQSVASGHTAEHRFTLASKEKKGLRVI